MKLYVQCVLKLKNAFYYEQYTTMIGDNLKHFEKQYWQLNVFFSNPKTVWPLFGDYLPVDYSVLKINCVTFRS